MSKLRAVGQDRECKDTSCTEVILCAEPKPTNTGNSAQELGASPTHSSRINRPTAKPRDTHPLPLNPATPWGSPVPPAAATTSLCVAGAEPYNKRTCFFVKFSRSPAAARSACSSGASKCIPRTTSRIPRTTNRRRKPRASPEPSRQITSSRLTTGSRKWAHRSPLVGHPGCMPLRACTVTAGMRLAKRKLAVEPCSNPKTNRRSHPGSVCAERTRAIHPNAALGKAVTKSKSTTPCRGAPRSQPASPPPGP